MVHDMRTTFLDLVHGFRNDSMVAEIRRRSSRGLNGKPQPVELSHDFQSRRTITLLHTDECRASLWQRRASSCLGLREGPSKILIDAQAGAEIGRAHV